VFQPQAPTQGTTRIPVSGCRLQYFNHKHPYGVQLGEGVHSPDEISTTHARTGRNHALLRASTWVRLHFNHTRPHRAQQEPTEDGSWRHKFQPHTPTQGATKFIGHGKSGRLRFQPRTPTRGATSSRSSVFSISAIATTYTHTRCNGEVKIRTGHTPTLQPHTPAGGATQHRNESTEEYFNHAHPQGVQQTARGTPRGVEDISTTYTHTRCNAANVRLRRPRTISTTYTHTRCNSHAGRSAAPWQTFQPHTPTRGATA